jgi:hypothetical protein
MIDVPKLELSAEELQLVTNSEWILTKCSIIEKANKMLGELAEKIKSHIDTCKNRLPDAVLQSSPKIAKGENYLQLPYLILDYPRCFNRETIFAIRTMFWWGNFFSVTLHLSGQYKEQYKNKIVEHLEAIKKQQFFICINEEEWQHHFKKDNYLPAVELTKEEVVALFNKQHFLKIAVAHSLHQWNEMPALLEKSFENVLKIIID